MCWWCSRVGRNAENASLAARRRSSVAPPPLPTWPSLEVRPARRRTSLRRGCDPPFLRRVPLAARRDGLSSPSPLIARGYIYIYIYMTCDDGGTLRLGGRRGVGCGGSRSTTPRASTIRLSSRRTTTLCTGPPRARPTSTSASAHPSALQHAALDRPTLPPTPFPPVSLARRASLPNHKTGTRASNARRARTRSARARACMCACVGEHVGVWRPSPGAAR